MWWKQCFCSSCCRTEKKRMSYCVDLHYSFMSSNYWLDCVVLSIAWKKIKNQKLCSLSNMRPSLASLIIISSPPASAGGNFYVSLTNNSSTVQPNISANCSNLSAHGINDQVCRNITNSIFLFISFCFFLNVVLCFYVLLRNRHMCTLHRHYILCFD